jgi:transcriptional regulator with XRE-family HTH domain
VVKNPLAARRRLAAALLALREDRRLTHAQLAAKSGVSGSMISRLENAVGNLGRKPNLLPVRQLLDALGVERRTAEWERIEQYAEDGAARGWWEAPAYAQMGERQRDFAIVEVGAQEIREYAAFLLPGLVQTRAYAHHRALVADGAAVNVEAIVAGRLRRQQQITGPDAARYQLVLEEQTVRRHPVPPAVMLDQLRHLLALMDRSNISIRVVPVDAQTANAVPRSPFGLVSYPDRDDPRIVTVDTVTADLLVTDVDEVDGYAQLHQQLRGAALSDADSAALVSQVADKLAASI